MGCYTGKWWISEREQQSECSIAPNLQENGNHCESGWPSVRPDMRYCFRSGRFRPNPRMKHISVPPRHTTKSYIPDFIMISQHYRYKDTHHIQSAYKCLNTIQQRKIHV